MWYIVNIEYFAESTLMYDIYYLSVVENCIQQVYWLMLIYLKLVARKSALGLLPLGKVLQASSETEKLECWNVACIYLVCSTFQKIAKVLIRLLRCTC